MGAGQTVGLVGASGRRVDGGGAARAVLRPVGGARAARRPRRARAQRAVAARADRARAAGAGALRHLGAQNIAYGRAGATQYEVERAGRLARRGDVGARQQSGEGRAGGARRVGDEAVHDARDRAPAVDGAHRRQDRRVEGGAVVEEGTYDELLAPAPTAAIAMLQERAARRCCGDDGSAGCRRPSYAWRTEGVDARRRRWPWPPRSVEAGKKKKKEPKDEGGVGADRPAAHARAGAPVGGIAARPSSARRADAASSPTRIYLLAPRGRLRGPLSEPAAAVARGRDWAIRRGVLRRDHHRRLHAAVVDGIAEIIAHGDAAIQAAMRSRHAPGARSQQQRPRSAATRAAWECLCLWTSAARLTPAYVACSASARAVNCVMPASALVFVEMLTVFYDPRRVEDAPRARRGSPSAFL